MKPSDIRSEFLQFFEDRGHECVPSSPVVPENDPTLLFTNAGMNQFKDLLLGNEQRDYKRATSSQKCIRAGGKHNDLDEVGKDGRHLTFFEMLGNWSFGDYYKKQAIRWAWDFILEVLEFDVDRLYVTIYKDDDESFDIWVDDIEVDPDRIVRLGDIDEGDEENFWSMGPTGPCGPCTEIHYDLHPEKGDFDFAPGYDEERINEIWNLVFMEFNRDEDGNLDPLPLKSVDTGLGLERVAMIDAGADNVFKTELFEPIFRDVAGHLRRDQTGDVDTEDRVVIDGAEIPIGELLEVDNDYFPHLAVIGDHIRTLMFAICDGARFSNEGRGYVLRRILRRAVRFGRELGFEGPFLGEVGQTVIDHYGDAYPDLEAVGKQARQLIELEEQRFFDTIDSGIETFRRVAEEAESEDRGELTGKEVFDLHATYGFPPDLTEIMAEERGLEIDWDGYEKRWEEHRETSRSKDVHAEATGVGDWETIHEGPADEFTGYHSLEETTRIQKIRHVDGDDYELLLERTPFYAESGGQVGDRGEIASKKTAVVFDVVDTQRTPIGIVHRSTKHGGELSEDVLEGEFGAMVFERHRQKTACNHTATHLLHAALREEISESIFQAGSLVAPDRLRFDFQYGDALTDDELRKLEQRVNERIREHRPVEVDTDIDRDVAVDEMGAVAIFGEKYGDRVRVVDIPGESTELCGGTHVDNTGEIGAFRITSESSVGSGIRRIEAVTEQGAFDRFERERELLEDVAEMFDSDVDHLTDRIESVLDEKKQLERQVDSLSQQLADRGAKEMLEDAADVDGITVVARIVEVEDRDQMLAFADKLRNELGDDEGAALVGAEIDGKAALACLLTEPAVESRGLKAGDLINDVAIHVDGRGGGRPTLAQAGGSNPKGLHNAADAFEEAVRRAL